ncbi:hypothetical protein [Dyadobacter helix]|nr:hypothetical protein [Dyadobacter sp. CECT 9275]
MNSIKFFRAAFLWTLVTILSHSLVRAQSDLLSTLKEVSAQLKTVKTSGNEWKQSLRANGLRPYQVFYEITGTDKKGQTVTRLYEFNLADIDPASIKYEAKKDEMLVKMKAIKGHGFIKEKEGEQQVKYVSEITLYADQIDNAKALTAALQKSVPLAQKAMESKLKIVSKYSFLTDWLKANVISLNAAGESYKQGITYAEGFKNLRVKLILQPGDKGKVEEEIFDFNLADMDERNVEMGVSGKWIYLELATRSKQGYIKYVKNGKVQSNEKSVRFYFDDVERAREGKLILQKLLPLAGPVSDELKPVYSSLADGLKKIKTAVKNTPEIGQSIVAECQAILSVNENGKVSEYRFAWGDINESSPKIKVSGKVFEMSVETRDKQKFIEVWKNGEKQSYTSSFDIISDDIESIRYLPEIVKRVITDCRASVKPVSPKPGMETQFINERLTNSRIVVKAGAQVLEKAGKCQLVFKRTITDGKNAGPLRYELSLTEMDASSVEMVIAGSSVFVNISTRNKEKTIKSFKGDTPSDYVNMVKIECENIVSGRQIADTLKKIVSDCKK